MTRTMNRILWTVQVLMAMTFLFAGVMKLILPIEAMRGDLPLPGAFLRFLGVAEIFGGLGLVLPGLLRIRPALTPLAAVCLIPIMIGATVLTAYTGQYAAALMPFVVGLLTAFVAYGRSRPGTFRVERAATIQSPPEQVFPLIHDFRQWANWSPWEHRDPAMSRAYSGAPAGPGAVYQWSGDNKVGEGRMEIIETTPPSKVRIKLDFLRPFEGHQTAEFTLVPGGDTTTVTWAAYGPTTYLSLLMSVFVSMDSLIGKDFESGLTNLKAITELQPKPLIKGASYET
jgi:uncharacterized protein YndB with AHSA1/START domain